MARAHFLWIFGFLAAPAAANAAAGKSAKHGKHTVALAPAEADGNVAKSALGGIDRALASNAGGEAEVVNIKALDKRGGATFAGAVRQCHGEAACLKRLARSSRVDAILVPLAKSEPAGTKLTITVAGAEGVRKVSFTFVTSADLNSAIAANAGQLFGDEPGPGNQSDNLEGLAALPLEPLETVAPSPTLEPQAPAKPEMKPEQGPPLRGAHPTPPALIEPPPLDDSIIVRREAVTQGPTWKTYVGASVAVVGAAGLVYGVLQYVHHKSLVDDANANPNLTQREAKQIDDEAQSAYTRSQLGIFVGGPLLVAGAALLTWDLLASGHGTAAATNERRLRWALLPVSGGAEGSLSLAW